MRKNFVVDYKSMAIRLLQTVQTTT
jgi:hypothetical protein